MNSSLAVWVAGARPRTLPAAIAPILAGAASALALTGATGGRFWLITALCAVVALALQVGVNYANDYSDGVRGTDDDRVGPLRLVGSGLASAQAVRTAAFAAFGVGAVAGLVVVALSGQWWLLAVGAAAIAAAWFYTGGSHPYGYAGLGEVFVFVFFGLVAVSLLSMGLAEKLAEVEPFKTTFLVGIGNRSWPYASFVLAILAVSVFIERPYCKYICPLGASLAMPSTFRWFGLRRKADCNACKACAKGCGAQAINPAGQIDHRECLHCLDCMVLYTDAAGCPPLAKERKLREREGQPLTAIARDGYFIPIVPVADDRQHQHARALLAKGADTVVEDLAELVDDVNGAHA